MATKDFATGTFKAAEMCQQFWDILQKWTLQVNNGKINWSKNQFLTDKGTIIIGKRCTCSNLIGHYFFCFCFLKNGDALIDLLKKQQLWIVLKESNTYIIDIIINFVIIFIVPSDRDKSQLWCGIPWWYLCGFSTCWKVCTDFVLFLNVNLSIF